MFKVSLLSLVLAMLTFGLPAPAAADEDGVVRFATLPKPGPRFPEGIAADARGRIFVATFEDPSVPSNPNNVIYVFDRNGHLDATISLQRGVRPIGMEFNRGDLYVADIANGTVIKFIPPFNSGSLPAQTFPVCAAFAGPCGLNAITFDARDDLYVSDSFGGRVFKLDLPAGTPSEFVTDELLKPAPAPHGFPPFGANGLAFDRAGANLYVANTADDRILKVDVATKAVTQFAQSINGADGIAFDDKGRLWVAANQADELVALNNIGRVVERRGSFQGVGKDGAAKGLLFPASIVISRGSIFVTNLALPLTPLVGDEPEDDVTTYTVSRIPLSGRD
jgi:DNA-binding beta-propeller fold protein YncE